MGAEPLEMLRGEHAVIERVLALLEREVRGQVEGAPPIASPARWCVEFLQRFADACHHAKEESALFPLLEAHGLPRGGGPIGVMLHEHDLGRALVRRMADALACADAGAFAAAASEYAALLRQHIAKENDVLFRLAESRISPDDAIALAQAFERIEREKGGHDLHHRFHRELEEWERKMLG
jgi:hemerythrin-like domain-containing protein